jgi:hypothetical protein
MVPDIWYGECFTASLPGVRSANGTAEVEFCADSIRAQAQQQVAVVLDIRIAEVVVVPVKAVFGNRQGIPAGNELIVIGAAYTWGAQLMSDQFSFFVFYIEVPTSMRVSGEEDRIRVIVLAKAVG